MTFFRLDNKWLIQPLFLCLMAYVVLRAWFVEPLFDELATLYWYIQTGFLPGRGAAMDANNHVLNSLISHQLFRVFGDHFMAYRLFSVSTFPIYFFASRKLLLKTTIRFRLLIFIALISVHWIFDYFSFSRGYGPSLAFLMLSFCLIQNWLETFRVRSFVLVIGCFLLALLSNLSLLLPIFILICFLILYSFVSIRSISTKQLVGFWSATLFFLAFLVPVYIYLNKLKKAGALWWGSTEGLWEVTGKSLCKNVFFSDNDLLKWIVLPVMLLIVYSWAMHWKSAGFKAALKNPTWWIPSLLIFTLIGIELSSRILRVNYPMDRVGMYLVPLFILSFGFVLEKSGVFRWASLLLLWFPASFLLHLNLDTSVFSPEDRIHRIFYRKIQTEVPDHATISADYVSQASYAYLSRQERVPHLATDLQPDDTLSRGDYHISWVEELKWSNYTCILTDPVSKTRLYKRTSAFKKDVLLDTLIPALRGSSSFISVLDFDLAPYSGELIQTCIDGEVELDNYSLELNLRHELQNKAGALRRTDNTRFNWYFGRKTHYRFHYPNHPIAVMPEDTLLRIRFYNDDLQAVNLKAIRVKILRITKSSDNLVHRIN